MSVKLELIKATSYDSGISNNGKSNMNVLMKSDCRKFAPNIFNKSKCQNCFKTKDAHSAEALECNRATRKIAKCGYLFVAPDWDFSISINRTKRWQRRWFVLYDDGELTYSVDEHPNTIPQALIDMNKVLEVTDAEQVTGNQYSLSIRALDRVHFVKGTSRDETKWWCDLLSHYSHGTVRGRLKRNTTFPGVITTTNSTTTTTTNNNNINNTINDLPEKQTVEQLTNNFNESVSNNYNNINNKHLSGVVELEWRSIAPETSSNEHKEVLNNSLGHTYHGNTSGNTSNKLQQMTPDNSIKPEDLENLNNLIISSLTSLPAKKMPPDSTQEQENVVPKDNNNLSKPEKLETDPSKSRSRRYVKRESRGLRSQRSRSDGVAKMIPSSATVSSTSVTSRTTRNILPEPNIVDDDWSSNCIQNPLYLLSSDGPNLSHIDIIGKDKLDGSPLTGHRRRHASSGQELVRESKTEPRKVPSARDLLLGDHSKKSPKGSPLLIRRHSFNRKVRTYDEDGEVSFQGVVESIPKRSGSLSRNNSLRKEKDLLPQVRGDPDGCLPSSLLPNPEEQVEIKVGSSEKNGWLFRYGMHKEWFKHWFVLRKSMLCYFRDPSAEVSGIMDGVLDLGLVKDVQELASDTNHSFTITTWDNKKHVLAASRALVRSDWVRAIAAAANLRAKSVFRDEDRDSIIQDIEKLNLKLSSHLEVENLTLKEDRNQDPAPDCASSTSSDDHSEYFSVVDEDDLAERSALPPSPPVNRTAISRVKQKARSRSSSRSRSKRKLRSSSDLGSASSFDLGGDSNVVDTTIVPEDCDAKHETKEKPIVKASCQNLLVAQINDDSKSGDKPTGNYRNLLDKYNILRKELDFHRPGDSDKLDDEKAMAYANDALVENIFKLMKDCKSFLSRLRETLRSRNEGELRLPIMELSLQWKEIKAVCTKLDSILCKLSGVDDGNGATKSEYPDLLVMVDKARDEIKRLKKDLKASQDSFDDLELHCYKLKQDMNNADDLHKSHMSLMTARVDDLTSKLTASERSLRLAKQRVAKLEARQERRRSSLKGKEAVSLSKEFEGKLSELEQKIGSIETSLRSNQSEVCDASQDKNKDVETQSSSTIDTSATGMLLRLHSLHTKVSAASVTASELSSATSSPPNELASDLASSPPPMLPPAQLALEKPKICLQVKGGGLDESGSGAGNGEDAIENWSSLSVTTSMSDLHTIEPDEEPPGNLEECLNVLSQKLDILLSWLQSSVQNLTTEDSLLVNNLPEDHLKVAKILEEYLSTQLGGDESTINSVSYLTLLRKAVTMINSVVQTRSLNSNQGLKNNELAQIRLKKLSKAIEQNLKLDSDFENSVHLLEEMILIKGDDLNSDNYFEYSENVIENLKNFKQWKIEEVLLPKTYCDVPVKDSDFSSQQEDSSKLATDIPIDRLRSSAEAILNGFLFNNADGVESNDKSKEKIMVLIDSELNLLKKDLDKKIGELDSEDVKEDIENVALVGVLDCLASFVLKNVMEPKEGEDVYILNNALLSLIEALVARWSLQLLAKSLVCVSTDLKKKSKEISQWKRKIQCLEEEDEQRKMEPCVTCRDLQKQVCRLQTDLRACQRRMGQGGVPCERCRELHRRMEILSERHQMELSSSLEREREEHREELRNRIAELTVIREMEKNADREEVAKLKQELKAIQNQAQVLKSQFDEQLRSLREAYEEKINFSEKSVEFIGEAVLQKYQSEMEDLKGLCEKGLLAVDQCHRKELMDLTQKQQKEIEQLKAEKERALAEESQATATAVEALKRSHRDEMERELNKLREEILLHVDTPKDSNLEEIKREILQLSEKYSRKCLEHSALEEKLNILSQQMQQTNHQMLDLLARNRQLQAHLSSDLTEKRDEIQMVSSETGELDGSENMEQLKKLLVLRETELVAEREEKARVNQQLIQARNELTQQDIRCRQLDQGLRMQRRLWLGQAGALKNRLEAIATAASSSNIDAEDYKSHLLGYKRYLTSSPMEDRMRLKPRRTTSFTSLVPRELLRSPSCPGLATPSSSLT